MSPASKATDTELADMEATETQPDDLEAIVTAIANSPIVVNPVASEFVLSDWERVRHTPEVDGFILAWIASHVRPRNPKTLS